MIDYSNDIRQRVQLAIAAKKPPTPPAETMHISESVPITLAPKKKESSFLTVFVSAALTILVLALVIMPLWGHLQLPQVQSQQKQVQPQPQIPQNPSVALSDYNKDKANLDEKINNLGKSIDNIKMRIWVLGLAHNENTNVDKKLHANEKGYITLDEEWRLSKLPATMELSPEQKEQLKNWTTK